MIQLVGLILDGNRTYVWKRSTGKLFVHTLSIDNTIEFLLEKTDD